jgi:hypothetical protein
MLAKCRFIKNVLGVTIGKTSINTDREPSGRIISGMSKKQHITARELYLMTKLTRALLHEEPMSHRLYKYELEEYVESWKASIDPKIHDMIIVLTENTGDVAMVMIMRDKTLFVNEDALTLIELIWGDDFELYIRYVIDDAVQELREDRLPIYYVGKDFFSRLPKIKR